MKKINVLITGGGSPGIAGTIFSLRNNYEKRKIKIITTDIKDEVVGKYLSDRFYVIPGANEEDEYLRSVLKICVNEKIDVLFPQNTRELLILSNNLNSFENIHTKVIVSDYKNLLIANNKLELLKICKRISIPYPDYYFVDNLIDLRKAAISAGYPNKPIIVKPPDSNGSRGIRIIDDNKNYKDLYYSEKPTSLFMKLNQFCEILGEKFTPILVMEYLPGDEITIDVFRDRKCFISIPRKREEIRSGISFQNSAVFSKELIKYSKTISEYLNLKYCFGFQFKYDINGIPKILECNPRIQGTMIFSTIMGANMIYYAVKSALNESLPEYILDWDTKIFRYWGAVGINSKGIVRV